MAKDRARPFSRKHRRYWIPVTGGMILIGVVNVAIGYCSYTEPSEVHEKIIVAPAPSAPAPATPAADCPAELTRQVAAELPGATITACAPGRATVARGGQVLELTLAGDAIESVAEPISLSAVPAEVMRAFATAHPRTVPQRATRRTRRGGEPVYELVFTSAAGPATITLRPDGAPAR